MKVAVFTDSLGLPREVPEKVGFFDTWVSSLKEDYLVYQVSIGGGTILDLYSQTSYLDSFDPDVVFLQSGIVDCTPRALTKTENHILNKYRVSKKLLKYLLKERTIRFLRKNRKCNYTSIHQFCNIAKQFQKKFGHEKVYCIGVLPASDLYEDKVPGVQKNIEDYNYKLREIYKDKFIDLSSFIKEDIMTDNIHLTVHGNRKLFGIVNKIIKNHKKS